MIRLKDREQGCVAAIGFIFYYARLDRYFHSYLTLSLPQLVDLFGTMENYIGDLETLGGGAPYYSLQGMLQESSLIHHIDNQGSLWALVKGDSRSANSARIVHSLAQQQFALRCRPWYEYIESAANIADLPSRLDFTFVPRLRSTYVPMILPPCCRRQ